MRVESQLCCVGSLIWVYRKVPFHVRNDLFRLMIPPVNHQPPRLSGIQRRKKITINPSAAPIPNANRHPGSWNVARIEQHEACQRRPS